MIDFLPPAAQAVLNTIMETSTRLEYIDTPSLQEYYMQGYPGSFEIQTVTNCWAAACEFSVSMHGKSDELFTYLPSPQALDYMLRNEVQTVSADELAIGDFVVFKSLDGNGEEIIDHVARIVGPDLIIEKTEAYGNAPFRLSALSRTTSNLKKKIAWTNGAEMMEPEFVRALKSAAMSRLDEAEIGALAASSLADIVPILEERGIDTDRIYMGLSPNMSDQSVPMPQMVEMIPLITGADGRAYLDPDHPQTEKFKNILD